MKIFKEKSWSLDLNEQYGEVFLSAIDSTTGELVANLFRFCNDGRGIRC